MPLEQTEPTHHADRGKRPHALLSNNDLSDQMIHLDEIYDADDPRTSDVPRLINELIREYLIRQAENKIEPTEGVEEFQTVDEDFQDFHMSEDVFEQAWGIAKDFFLAPPFGMYGLYEAEEKKDDPNIWTTFDDENFLRYAKSKEGLGEPQGFNEDRKKNWMPTPTEPFRRGGSLIRPMNRPKGTVGVNLAGVYQDEGMDEEKLIERLASIMMHEDAHAATKEEINDAMETPTAFAHEIAAHHLQYPGGKDQEDKAIADLMGRGKRADPSYMEGYTPNPPRGVIR